MIKASIISIGNELLSGATIDTNAAWLSQELFNISIQRVSGYIVADDIRQIIKALQNALRDTDVIILTGGLGPTEDDITREAISKFYNSELVLNEEILSNIKNFFTTRGKEMPATNKKQAYIPKCAEPLFNSIGSAAGIKVERKGKLIYAIPGVPSEAKKMFTKSIKPELEQLDGRGVVSIRHLSCYGMSESQIAQLLKGRMDRDLNPLVNITTHMAVKTIHIIANEKTRKEADELAQKEQDDIARILGDIVYSCEKESLPEAIAQRLTSMNKTISVAESCTGGLIGKLLTDIPGSSNYFKGGTIAYSNEVKIQQLNVSPELINNHGAVSLQTAKAMVKGALEKFGSDIAVSTTGIAGPTGATPDKEVGLVYIGIAWGDNVYVKKCNFGGDRQTIRNLTANTALNLVRLKVLI